MTENNSQDPLAEQPVFQQTDKDSLQDDYQFTVDWFSWNKDAWQHIFNNVFKQAFPLRVLEIGSYEGRSTCFLIDTLTKTAPCEIHCIDSWEGGREHQDGNHDMPSVKERFMHNIKLSLKAVKDEDKFNCDVHIHQGLSQHLLPVILSNGGRGKFDFIYVDGSHEAPDVLFDAIMSFHLLRKGGIIAFDDYLWVASETKKKDYINHPKAAIDSFVNLFARKSNVLARYPIYQIYVQKVED